MNKIMKAEFWQQALIVCSKEMRCFFGTKRSFFSTLVAAIAVVPVYLWFGDMYMDSVSSEDTTYQIGVFVAGETTGDAFAADGNSHDDIVGEISDSEAIISLLSQIDAFEIQTLDFAEFENRGDLITDQTLDALLSIEDSGITAYFSSEYTVSSTAISLVQSILLENAGVHLEDVSETGGAIVLSYLYVSLGMMMVCVSVTSAIAISATFKEKESGTFEAFLSTGIHPLAAAIGKWFAIFATTFLFTVFCCISSIVALLGGLGESRSVVAWDLGVVLLVTALSASLLYSGLFVAVTSSAETQKEAQMYTSVLMLVAMLPSMFLMSASVGGSEQYWYIPSLNSALLIRDAFYGFFDSPSMVLSIIPGLVIAILGVIIASRFMRAGRVPWRQRIRNRAKSTKPAKSAG